MYLIFTSVKKAKARILTSITIAIALSTPIYEKLLLFCMRFVGPTPPRVFIKWAKINFWMLFRHEKLLQLGSVFYNVNATSDEIANSAYELIRGMYSNKAEKKLIEKSSNFTLSDLRYLHFSKAKLKSKFSLEALPPTEGAAKHHAFRVFYQIQLWLGKANLKATDWGWQVKNNHLIPVRSTLPPIPQQLLN